MGLLTDRLIDGVRKSDARVGVCGGFSPMPDIARALPSTRGKYARNPVVGERRGRKCAQTGFSRL
jgi:hypothetical protein